MVKLAPSILAANPCYLLEECRKAAAYADEIHFDVMDGHFVPNLSFGPYILKGLKKELDFRFDVHLMVTDPLLFLEPYAEAGANVLTVHVEAREPEESLKQIRRLQVEAGLSLKPKTPVSEALPYLELADRILLMTVEPGFGGQKLIPEVLSKAQELRRMGYQGVIQADGGITRENAAILVGYGIDDLVMGTAFFKAEHPEELSKTVHALKSKAHDIGIWQEAEKTSAE